MSSQRPSQLDYAPPTRRRWPIGGILLVLILGVISSVASWVGWMAWSEMRRARLELDRTRWNLVADDLRLNRLTPEDMAATLERVPEGLGHSAFSVRIAAASAACDLLMSGLLSPEYAVSQEVVDALLDAFEAVPGHAALALQLLEPQHYEPDETRIDRLVRLAGDPDPMVRANAVQVLIDWGGPNDVGNPVPRRDAIRDQALPAVLACLADEEAWVRAKAAPMIWYWWPADGPLTEPGHFPVAGDAPGSLEADEVLPMLRDLLDDPWLASGNVVLAIGAFGSEAEQDLPRLREMTERFGAEPGAPLFERAIEMIENCLEHAEEGGAHMLSPPTSHSREPESDQREVS